MKKQVKIFVYLFFSILLVSCSASQQDNSAVENVYTDTEQTAADSNKDISIEDPSNGVQLIGEKVIKTVEINYKTAEYDQTINFIMNTVSKHNAYMEYSYESTYSSSGYAPDSPNRDYRQMNYTFRVPTKALEEFMRDMEDVKAVKISEQIGSEDVTQQYRDTEIRIRLIKQKEERLNALMAEADTIDQIIQIENSLSDTISEREQLQSQLDHYDDLIEYTAVYMSIEERQRISVRGDDSLSFWDRMKEALINSLLFFYYWIQNAFIWIIYALPFLLIIALLLLLFFFFKKKRKKRHQG